MNKPDAAAKVANLAQNLESLLSEKRFSFFRQTIEQPHRDIFYIICDTNEKGLVEQRITAYIHDKLIFFEAAVPVTHTDDDAVAALVNNLNLIHPFGTFQLDLRDGELNWTNYLAARNGAWPGNDIVLSMLESAKEMAGVLYRELLSVSGASTSKGQ